MLSVLYMRIVRSPVAVAKQKLPGNSQPKTLDSFSRSAQ